MLRAIIGYILGFLSGALVIVAILAAKSNIIFFTVIFSIIIFIAVVIFAHRHHIKMRNRYYDNLKKGADKWHI